jgi:predicted flap endonuclease-1-like 5' DNA nuclease
MVEPAPADAGRGPDAAPAPARASEPAPASGPKAPQASPASSSARPEPERIDRVEGEEKHGGARPVGYTAPLGGVPDDLRRIKGIGPRNEARLHALGVWRYSQIAAWDGENVRWLGSYLSFPGRINRERWIEQATELAAGLDSGQSHVDGSHVEGAFADLSEVKRRE